MKILWVKTDFLHPTNRGGQIRTLEMLKCLHERHEIHYVAFDDGRNPEGLERSSEYCSHAYSVAHSVPQRRSLAFVGQLFTGVISPLPVAVQRYASAAMKRRIETILAKHKFDSLVCDFLFPAANIPDLRRGVLFQHQLASVIWRRHYEQATNRATRAYLRLQAERMYAFERKVCREAGHIIAVSDVDRDTMRSLFDVECISRVDTGVDIRYFSREGAHDRDRVEELDRDEISADFIFVGSMDWLPNIDAVQFFVGEILPRIRKERPDCRLMIAGRRPSPSVHALSDRDSGILVSGTVPDIRPYLWASTISVVPLRIGGGTRLKIFEAMAAGLPVISTSIGAEGLPVENGTHISIADNPEAFARRCLELLRDAELRRQMVRRACELIVSRFSWEAVASEFEAALESGPRPN